MSTSIHYRHENFCPKWLHRSNHPDTCTCTPGPMCNSCEGRGSFLGAGPDRGNHQCEDCNGTGIRKAKKDPPSLVMLRVEVERAVKTCFPDRAEEMLLALKPLWELAERTAALTPLLRWECAKCGFYYLSDRHDLDTLPCPYCYANGLDNAVGAFITNTRAVPYMKEGTRGR
jgi:hypothetical protein